MVGQRFAVLCNGRPVPLHPTGKEGEFVAGVRYRAWQPTSCLHPDIPIHSPLVFDIVDTLIPTLAIMADLVAHGITVASRTYR